ncbi:hypothetical protein ACFXI8_27155 [Streptomyces niveus]|uniref:hypothetical protein n=1 Tax=Streptomyces niveus TaxID=193462 RepID=UPI00368D1BA7
MPKFHFQPDNEEQTRFKVFTDTPGDNNGLLYLGVVYETADRNWVAEWAGRSTTSIAMPGFATLQYAAEALHYYERPVQSLGSRPAGQHLGLVDERNIDLSVCGCCINNHCECEGTSRVSQQTGIKQSYEIQPSLIPQHGVLVSLMPMPDGDFLVDMNTRGAGSGIGYLQRRDDGRYNVRIGSRAIGIAAAPEAGMWATLRDHSGSKFYVSLTKGFEPRVPDTSDAPTHTSKEQH